MTPTDNSDTPITGNSFKNLLFLLVLYIAGSPFLMPFPSLAIITHIVLSIALLVAVYTVQRQRHHRSLAVALLLPLLALYWLALYNIIELSALGAHLLFCIYYGLLVYSFVQQIRSSKEVDSNVLYATFSLYLIIGMFWGSLYALLDLMIPGSYTGALLDTAQNRLHDFNYFSFVTLTTLGYGDITPQNAGAASLCQMEAIVGQFYTAVVVAWFVGMHVSSRYEKEKEKGKT